MMKMPPSLHSDPPSAVGSVVCAFETRGTEMPSLMRLLSFSIADWNYSVDTVMCLHLDHSCFASKSRENVVHVRKEPLDISHYPPERIRNFSIIAHVDHGKSTLADRLLEFTGTISSDVKNEQVLDKLQVERERGITVKAQTATLFYQHKGEKYLLNLIDTPGHVDFNYEVSRSLAACDGVILLVDANQGVQAQTVANFFLAFEADLTIIPVLNKIDLKGADVDNVMKQMENLFDMEKDEILKVSAKTGYGVEELMKAVIDRIPSPAPSEGGLLKALLFDSGYDRYKGAVPLVRLLDGHLKKGDKIVTTYTGKVFEVAEVGVLHPDQTPCTALHCGQVGYMMASMRHTTDAQIGDTVHHQGAPVQALPGFKPAKPMVFAGVYPTDQSELPSLKTALDKLLLNDSSVSVNLDSSPALGQGWRLGFLGLLHMEVFNQRLEQEFDANIIMTSPNVPYRVKITGAKNIKYYGGETVSVLNPALMPDPSIISEYLEPMISGTIIAPDQYLSAITSLVMDRRGDLTSQTYIDNSRLMYKVIMPLNEIVLDFYDELKSRTSGYASFDYEDHGYQASHLTKLDFLLNGKAVEEMTIIAHHAKARQMARVVCQKLKDVIPSQMYEVVIQGAIGGKIICRETVKAKRKDVTAKLYGGDVTRRQKLLKRQSEGKKRMRQIGNVEVPKDAFIKVLKR